MYRYTRYRNFLGHQETACLFISSSVNIIGEAKVDKSKIVVDSGFYIVGKNVEGNVHLEHI